MGFTSWIFQIRLLRNKRIYVAFVLILMKMIFRVAVHI